MPTLEQQLAAARESHRQKILDSYTSHLAALPEETRIVGSDPQSVFLYGTLMHPSVCPISLTASLLSFDNMRLGCL